MIVQCERCGTRYRFDEANFTGEGVWVRCSRCTHVFFHGNPFSDIPAVDDTPEEPAVFAGMTGEPAPVKDDAPLNRANFEELHKMLEEIDLREETSEVEKEILGSTVVEEGREDMPAESARKDRNIPSAKRRPTLRAVGTFFLTPLLIIFIMAGVYLWLFPEIGAGLIEEISGLPGFERIFGTDQHDRGAVSADLAAVDFADIQERYVTNWIVGNLLVIEGRAVNNNPVPVSDIRVRGKLVDSGGTVLMEQEYYCGTILSDEELINLTEKEMADALSVPGGSSFLNRNIASRGSVPFMMVFANPVMSVNEVAVELAGIEEAD